MDFPFGYAVVWSKFTVYLYEVPDFVPLPASARYILFSALSSTAVNPPASHGRRYGLSVAGSSGIPSSPVATSITTLVPELML